MVKSSLPTRKFKSNQELIQINSMKLQYPQFKYQYNSDNNLLFTGIIQPSWTMPKYKISVEYRNNEMPRVRVIEPTLVIGPPHYHHNIDCLCLYKPIDFKWTAAKLISKYIITWSTCWLYFYEVWKDTGIWYGPEAEHIFSKYK